MHLNFNRFILIKFNFNFKSVPKTDLKFPTPCSLKLGNLLYPYKLYNLVPESKKSIIKTFTKMETQRYY